MKRQRLVRNKSKRVGRGYGSGKGGHTAGRGAKGQKVRSKVNVMFEGVKVKKSLLRRLPLRRGKGKFKARIKPLVVKIDYLNLLEEGAKVNVDTLVKAGVVKQEDGQKGVKILSGGKLRVKKLQVELPISGSAARQIEKLGGTIKK